MIIDTTNDELLINGQRWQRGGYLLATAYATDQINITARDGRVIGKAIEWDRILDKDKNTFGLDRDGTVTALTNIFNSQVKSPYKIDALRDVENGTAAYGEIMIYRSPGEWQYEVLEQYHGAYDSEAATLRSGATATLELYYTAQADGDGISELSQSNTPASGYQIIRKLYYAEKAQQDPDTGTWVQFADVAANTSFNDAKNTLLAYLKERTGGTVPISLKMTWEEVEIYNGLLDSYGGAAAAYSVRRLSSSYTGSLIQVERASDNTTQDIGYDSNGDLDTAAIATFCSGTTCGVRVWYDQSGSGNDATQTTFANQPTIYTGGAVVLENGKPAVEFNGTSHGLTRSSLTYGNELTLISLYNQTNDAQGRIWGDDITGQQGYWILFGADSEAGENQKIYINDGAGFDNWTHQTAPANQQNLLNIFFDNTEIIDSLNGVTQSQSVTGFSVPIDLSGSSAGFSIGNSGNMTTPTAMKAQEFILYNSNQSTNRSGIETNINDYFGIYTPFTTGLLDDYGGAAAAYSLRRLSSTYTGDAIRVRRASDNAEQDIGFDIEGNLNTAALASFCSGTNGFVKTWYDQAGSNDVTQTTVGYQPKIYDSSTGVIEDGSAGNEKPAMEFDGTNDGYSLDTSSLNIGSLSSFTVGKYNDTAGSQVMLALSGSNGNTRWYVPFLTAGNFAYGYANNSSAITTTADTNQNLHVMIAGATLGNAQAWLNSVSVGTTTRVSATSSNENGIANYENGFYADCKIQEIIYYASDQSSNRSGIETNINDFYSIYP